MTCLGYCVACGLCCEQCNVDARTCTDMLVTMCIAAYRQHRNPERCLQRKNSHLKYWLFPFTAAMLHAG
jgi:hypothetical protein